MLGILFSLWFSNYSIMWWKQYAIFICRAKESILSREKAKKKEKEKNKYENCIVWHDLLLYRTSFFLRDKTTYDDAFAGFNSMAVICVYKLKPEPLTFTFIRSKRAPNAFVSTSKICWMIYWISAKKTENILKENYDEWKSNRMR